jgi:GNAT superfamily N-acetyltransferase
MNLELKIDPLIRNEELNALFKDAWPDHEEQDFRSLLDYAWFYACGYSEDELIGFAKVLGDGRAHGFLLDPTVSPEHQRKGIGRKLVELCVQESRRRGIEWLHVDFEPHLKGFYETCGFRPTHAGLIDLRNYQSESGSEGH